MRTAALVVLALLLPVWTWALVTPNPVPPAVEGLLGFWEHAKFAAAKSLHAGVYAALAGLGVYGLGPRWKFAVVGLMLHGVATEIIQTAVPGRSGSVRDVLIDWAGIAVATLVVRRWRP